MKDKRTTPAEMLGQWVSSARFALLPIAMIGGLAMGTIAACGPDNTAGQDDRTCIADDDCELGTVCILTSKTCESVDCSFCISGQICYTDSDGIDSCSKPECTSNSQCEGMESCVEGACIEASCSDKSECSDGQICNPIAGICQNPPDTCTTNFDCPVGNVCGDDGMCSSGCTTDQDCDDVMTYCNTDNSLCEPGCRTDASCAADQSCSDARQCECDPSKCAEGSICDESVNACIEKAIESCDEVTCGDGFVCNPDNNFMCEPAPDECSTVQGDPNACPPGTRCNQATGDCEVMTCTNGKSQADCDGTNNPVFSEAFCECVQCVDDTNCAAGSSCNSNGQCIEGCVACSTDPNNPAGACMDNAAPFCFSGCCVECTNSTECAGADVCLNNGRCGPPPSCAMDPTVCPAGTVCVSEVCQPTMMGACDITDTTSCPPGQMCMPDPITGMNTCQGGGQIGECSPACINGLECTIGFCTGCVNDGQCNPGQTCNQIIPLLPGICM
jgi:hypothetical protein